MATLTFSFDTGSVPLSRIVDAFATAYNYQAILPATPLAIPPLPERPNPETKEQFARRMVRRYIRETVVSIEHNVAREALTPPTLALDGVTKD